MLDLRSVKQAAAMLAGIGVGLSYRTYCRVMRLNIQAGFAYARTLRDPAFRERLRTVGPDPLSKACLTVIAVEAVMPASEVARRITQSRMDSAGQFILAIQDPHSPHGFFLAKVTREPRPS